MALRGAFIGFGNVAAKGHLPAWRDRAGVEIVAAADTFEDRRATLAAALPEARFYTDPAEMLARERLDFVDICAPPGRHAALIRLAQDAGLHTLCEKPTVTRFKDLVPLAAEARRRGLVLHSVHNWLKAPLCRKVTDLIDAAALGPVRQIEWRTLRREPAMTVSASGPANWRVDPATAGGGILVDHGWHALYCVARWARGGTVSGGTPVSIAAKLENRKFDDWQIEDTANVTVTFPRATASFFLTWTAEARENRIEIEGADGRLVVADDAVILESESGRRSWTCPPALSQGSHHPDWFSGVVADLLAAIEGRTDGGNLAEALFCAEAIAGAQASSAAGGAAVALDGS